MNNPTNNDVFSKDDIIRYKDDKADELIYDMNDFFEDKIEDFEELTYFDEVEDFINSLDEPLCYEFNALIEEVTELVDFCDNLEGYNGDTIINEDYFEDYVKEMLTDCGDLPSYIHIDWGSTASDIKMEYVGLEYENNTYYPLT